MRYPKTPHLPWSPILEEKDKPLIFDIDNFLGKHVVITEKLDGENTCFTNLRVHTRSPDAIYGKEEYQSYMMNIQAEFSHKLPENMIIYGENMYAIHGIEYNKLTSYLYGFAVLIDNQFLNWSDTNFWISGPFQQKIVPLITHFKVSENKEKAEKQLKEIKPNSLLGDITEGFIIRSVNNFHFKEFHENVAKYANKGVPKTDENWVRNWKKAQLKMN